MRTPILASMMLAFVASPAVTQVPGATPARIEAGTYAVDSGHTQVLFTVNHLGISDYTGQFTNPTGMLMLDPANAANDKVEIVFPIDKVSTTVPALDAHLKKADFFDAAKFPEGRFVSTKVTISGTSATIVGDLTLKGVTKPVILAARFVGSAANPMSRKANVGFTATTSIKRSDFGISAGVPMVSDLVRLTINAAFEMR